MGIKVTQDDCIDAFTVISDTEKLGRISVVLNDFTRGSGRITISTGNTAWTGICFGMGGRKLREFIVVCRPGDIADRIMPKRPLTSTDKSRKATEFCIKVVRCVQEALIEMANTEKSSIEAMSVRSHEIASTYRESARHTFDVDVAVKRLMTECGELFRDGDTALQFLTDEANEDRDVA